ncbi:MAG: hypothetical protein ACPIOQ_10280 [Promethearchaeia archaeon]
MQGGTRADPVSQERLQLNRRVASPPILLAAIEGPCQLGVHCRLRQRLEKT